MFKMAVYGNYCMAGLIFLPFEADSDGNREVPGVVAPGVRHLAVVRERFF